MIADKIEAFLGDRSVLDEETRAAILAEAGPRLEKVMARASEAREHRGGGHMYMSSPMFCLRQGAYRFHGEVGHAPEHRALVTFALGDLCEVLVLTLAEMAGVKLGAAQELLTKDLDGAEWRGRIDEMMEHEGSYYIVEVKSTTQQGMKRWQADPRAAAEHWDYYGQANRYAVLSGCEGFVFVIICRDTGSIEEYTFITDQARWEEDLQKAKDIVASDSPEQFQRAFEPEPEMEKVQGKAKIPDHWDEDLIVQKASWFSHPTGRKILGVQCGYCAFNVQCWSAQLEVQGGKPTWIVEEGET